MLKLCSISTIFCSLCKARTVFERGSSFGLYLLNIGDHASIAKKRHEVKCRCPVNIDSLTNSLGDFPWIITPPLILTSPTKLFYLHDRSSWRHMQVCPVCGSAQCGVGRQIPVCFLRCFVLMEVGTVVLQWNLVSRRSGRWSFVAGVAMVSGRCHWLCF